MAPTDIRRIMQQNRVRRIGEENTGEDPFVDPDMLGIPDVLEPQNSPVSLESSGDEPSANYKKFMDPKFEHIASDKLNDLLNNPPTRERPSLGRTLVGISAGLGRGGLKDAQTVMNEPYERKQEDWKTQAGPAYNAATIERYSNANERQLAGQMTTAAENERRNRANTRVAEERVRVAEDSNRIREENNAEKNQLARLKQKNSGIVFDFKGPTVTYVDRNNPGPPVDTHFPTGRLTDLDKLEMNQDNEMARIGARGAQARETKEAVPGFNPESITIRTDAAANKPLTAKEANDARSAELRRIKETDPEGEGRFIKLAPDGVTATLKERPGYGIPYWGDKANQQEIDAYDALNKRVSESIAPPKGAPGNTTTSNTRPAGQTSAGESYKEQKDAQNPNHRRKSYDGGKTWFETTDGGKTWSGGQ